MTVQDPTVTHAQLALEEAELIDAGPAVSWGAILAGALAAAALSFVLLAIGTAFGLSITAPWQFMGQDAGEAAATIGIGTAIFLVVVHGLASGTGGYLAGRLRSKIIGVRGDETFFRDTAHGLVVWAVSALVTIVMIAALAFAAARGGIALGAAAGEAAGGALSAAAEATTGEVGVGQDSIGYFVDWLFRPPSEGAAAQAPQGLSNTGQTTTQPAGPTTGTIMAMPERAEGGKRIAHDEVARIVRMALDGQLSAEDRTYIAQLVAQQTGMAQTEAEQRVSQVLDRAKAAQVEAKQTARQAADVARQAGMYTSLWAAITMLAGAFCASLAATWGGRARDL